MCYHPKPWQKIRSGGRISLKNSRSLNHQSLANMIMSQHKIIFSISLTPFSRPAPIQVNQNQVEIHHQSLIFSNLANRQNLAQELLLQKESRDWKYSGKNLLLKISRLFYQAIWLKTFRKHSKKINLSIHLLQEINRSTFQWYKGDNLGSSIKIVYSSQQSKLN